MLELSATDARRIRWNAHRLGGSELDPTGVVDRAVALQGQELRAVLQAIAIRSRPGTNLDAVRGEFDAGRLVRSWPLRGTLFATTPQHLADLRVHTAERTHRSAATRRAALGLDAAVIDRAQEIIDPFLDRGVTRGEVLALWQEAGIDTSAGRGYHLIFHLAVAGLAHWGPFADSGEQQLVRTTVIASDDPDASLARLLHGVVAARGPLAVADLVWWTKLPQATLRPALARLDDLIEARVEGTAMVMVGEPPQPLVPTGVTLVPDFDEWVLGYGDRALVASPRMLAALVPGNNGVFRPAVLVDGIVVGSWRVPLRGGRPQDPLLELVEPVSPRDRAAIDAALAAWPHSSS